MFLALFVCLFVFIGMYIGNKYDLKKISINILFGLFLINVLFSILTNGYYLLFTNYHGAAWYFVLLSSILGILLMLIIDIKYDSTEYTVTVTVTRDTATRTLSASLNLLYRRISTAVWTICRLR